MTRRVLIGAVVALALQSCAARAPVEAHAATPSPFGYGRAYYHPTAHAPYRFRDTIVRLRFDVERGIVYGDETAEITAKTSGLRTLPFDSAGIDYDAVSVDGRPADQTIDAGRERVEIPLASPAKAGEEITVRFRYHTAPKAGVYFIRPDRAYPDIAPEIWSQGEPTDNRRWFPTWDEPNEKTPSELVITVPRGWTVVANGSLRAHTVAKDTETFDWASPTPKSTYLISFAAGPLVEYRSALGALDVDSFVQPAYAGLNALCFSRTRDIIAYFERTIGVPFPWEKYDQTTAERYVFGGMEDASATLLTTRALHPPSEEPEASCDVLIAHELAQQWWGDDATMTDWSNVWLHEGFATYFDELWSGHRYGEDEFAYRRYQAQQTYFAETRQYLRPIVDYDYADPLDLFDASSHERPAQVLHMLRTMLGDKAFFGATRFYLERHAHGNADTAGFFADIDTYTGKDLTWFEDEWFFRNDYPHYVVRETYDAPSATVTLDVDQDNLGGKPYRMPIVVAAYFGGHVARTLAVVERSRQVIAIRGVTRAPDMVLFDPQDDVLKQLTFAQSTAALAYQLEHAPYVGAREWALEQLSAVARGSGSGRAAAASAIRRAATRDAFWGMRADAVEAAGESDDADAVHAGLKDADKRVRLAAESAAAGLRGAPGAVIADLDRLAGAADPNVAAAALTSLGALRAPKSYERLVAALGTTSFAQTVASGALAGLAAYGDARALPLIRARTAYGTEEDERTAAVLALARLAKRTQQQDAELPVLVQLLGDPLDRTRIAAADALALLGDPRAVPALERAQRADPALLVRDAAAAAVRSLHAS